MIIPFGACGINFQNTDHFPNLKISEGRIFLSDTKFKNTCSLTIHFEKISVFYGVLKLKLTTSRIILDGAVAITTSKCCKVVW